MGQRRAFLTFRDVYAHEYEDLDEACNALTVEEEEIGVFTVS
ncbi:MAG: hypothetical protein NVS9B15_15090 [Acidobacteriaceae bacterium]